MEQTKRLYIDFHVIQTVPPSCVNRDDTGSPKTAIYGGVQRARVSSQSWKRAMRQMFQENFREDELGVRTKKIVEMVVKEIQKIDDHVEEDKARDLAEKVLKACNITTKDGEAKALFFLSVKQAHNLAGLILENENPSKKDAQQMILKDHSVDIALFGRMVADDPTLNADATAQVAHSISTHRVDNEYDYFTAVDDMAPEDNAGAGMIGVVEFNSATLYRYATVAVHELHRELGAENEVVAGAVVEFAKAFITSMPTGKQNTFANRTLPDAVLVTIRRDQPVNLVGAFEKAVKARDEGYVQASIKCLNTYADKIYASFAKAPEKAWEIGMEGTAKKVDLVGLLEGIKKQITDDLKAPEE
jgi:CRISPR system Cascade subunit CasC